MACDFRIISESCKGIGFVHAKMGILPAWGGTNRLVHTVGHRKALDLLSTARIAAPSECLRIGLVDEVLTKKILFENITCENHKICSKMYKIVKQLSFCLPLQSA